MRTETDRKAGVSEDLLNEARAGNRQAFSEIVRIMMNSIVALTYKMTGDRDAAKDLAQDTFVAAWENLREFKGEARFENWLYRIASNKSINYLKRERRMVTVDDMELASTANPAGEHEENELRIRVLNFMKELPEQQRLVFELRFYKQLTFEEVSRATGKAVGTVKTLFREAVKKLRVVAVEEGWR